MVTTPIGVSSFEEDRTPMHYLFPRLKKQQNQTAGTMSGGEQQILAIARAMMVRPELILLDEPSPGLAPLVVKPRRQSRFRRRTARAREPRLLSATGTLYRGDERHAYRARGNLRPVATVIRVGNNEEALATANGANFGLSSGIATTSPKHTTHVKRNSEAGMVMVNLPTAGIDFHVPFGGRRGSSCGPREQGRYAAEFYTTIKTAYTFA
ncbi:hypothetical protein GGQ65_006037 [Rhizobium fabae]|uniref:ABC transporter domain-containing protein n=1 Tax=Rhizobium fabae TaxID=573179 RepID=A0A7W6FM07_9HYPH|nr:hypothetical protein [Rhizobium fabae]